ncbi:conserved hypothetical protein [Leishmania infantum JPCM5]|uniref:Gamma tubulin complex component protein N-terminal domain-containing protein n=2 Tax=Leishmania infantum TaxID=5671 RepID=A4IDJ8_LEIIN|nr:conserved hypothetical protein [Leishmania infantum JPCM5]CAC9550241.1 Spc97_/_Spc98_family_-_putative [Leishmania infantum]CAM72929.1 conserved hypothetical protein [Leishmania infantum JPCM5]SUZ46610.1 Spc97_/_Spc98_family_-_putative [Leishmania infantum]|eukprot:XP_001469817.1 conserved hypothetical protein [Leishmania infantum JPCM5]
MISKVDLMVLPSACSDDEPRSHGPHPDSPPVTSARCSAPLLPSGAAYRATPSTLVTAPGTQVSVLNLVSALPLLLSLDRSHYTATLGNAQGGVLDTLTAPAARGDGRLGPLSWTTITTDAATAAVRAVLYARGTPSWQAKRRRLRRLALDSFFRSTVSARISVRRERGAKGGDGVHEAVVRLLHHTRAVMSDISPTQAHLVDLFAAQIMCGAQSAGAAVEGSPHAAAGKAIDETTDAEGGQSLGASHASTAMMRERSKPEFERRGIMKSGVSPSFSVTASPRHAQGEITSTPASATVAEQLLYIILRTSIAANTPRRPLAMHGDDTPALLADGLHTSPPQGTDGATAVGGLTRKKPRLDNFDCISPATLSSENGQSIYRYSSDAGSANPATALPYEPYCWLAPSTVALVECSQALRRHQRWTCDLDPVIEATVAGEGSRTHSSHLFRGAGTRSAAVVSLLDSMRNSWAPLPGMADSDDAAVLTALVRDSGLPFAPASTSAALDMAHEAGPASHSRGFQWGQTMMGGEDPAVEALFADGRARRIDSRRGEADGIPGSEGATQTRQREADAAATALPACRIPFVSCLPLYDEVVYAQVHLALHWCTAGHADPFCLTHIDNTAGSNLPALRVRDEFYARPLPTNGGAGTAAAATAISGLASLLEWGCYYGTLLRRLHRLCDVADNVALRGTLGSYGRCAMSTLRLLLCLLQRQIGELGHQAGGPHRLSFAELLTAHQRLQRAVEQVEVLAAFFGVPAVAAVPEAWDPVDVLEERCSSALLISRLYECFTARHADALGRHGSAATHYHELQQERLAELLSSLGGEDSEELPLQANTPGGGADQQRQKMRAALAAVESGTAPPSVRLSPLDTGDNYGAWEQHRKDLLSYSIDVIGLLLRSTLRPLNAMLDRWLKAGELADPYDEFFVVPSHGQTHSGFTLEPSPQRLPVFLSVAAATDLLHAGVSLRVLRVASTHVVLSAQKDARQLEAMAEINEAAAEDYVGELLDTQTLRRAIEQFIEQLVHGAPTADAVHDMRHSGTGANDEVEVTDAAPMPLPPRVDLLSAYGAINWWKEHYQACTRVLLEVVKEAANPAEGGDEDGSTEAAPDPSLWLHADEEEGLRSAEEASAAENEHVGGATASETHTGHAELSLSCATAAPAARDDHHRDRSPHVTAAFPSKESTSEASSYITVFINSDDDEDRGAHSGMGRATGGRQGADSVSIASSSPRSSTTTTTSVLGLRRIAGSRFSTGTTVSSTASSRGTMALYGAITEELRQVSLLEQQTEADLGQCRQALRAEFDAQLWRRRRDNRLSDWKAQRLALRLRRVRAMEGIVEELRDVYMIRAVGHTEIQGSASRSIEEVTPSHQSRSEKEETEQHGAGQEPSVAGPTMTEMRVVVPLRQLPPPRVAPPVILYAVPDDEDGVDGVTGGRRGSRLFPGRSRRTSFAANTTIMELPATGARDTPQSCGRQRRSLSASILRTSNWPRTSGSPSSSACTARRVSAAAADAGGVTFIDPLSTGASVQHSEGVGAGPGIIRQLRDVATAALPTFGVMEKRSPVEPAQSAVATFTVPSVSTPPPMPPSKSSHKRCEQVEAAMLREHADMAAAVAADEAHAAAVRRDELGYAHPDALFRVADINDDDFLLMRTGLKGYARREAEAAALAELAERQAQLAAYTVDEPGYLRQLAAAAAAAVTNPCSGSPKGSTTLPNSGLSAQRRSRVSIKTERDGAARDDRAEEGVDAGGGAAHVGGSIQLPSELDPAWQQDDPQRGSREARATIARTASMAKSFTDELWSWTATEAHRWYFDDLVPLHHALTGAEVDRALIVDVALTCDEAEALQRCSGYYRSLGQYTASFLTHKALQLTLLPPYGSLYRLTTQFLDVCLLQRAPIAVRLMDLWMTLVDAALEMMAEAEEASMVQRIISGETRLSALAALADTRQGLNVTVALSSLNSAFQHEWATCVTNGESTVKLEWRFMSSGGEGHERLSSAAEALGSDAGFTEGDDTAEEGVRNVSSVSRLPHQPTPLSQGSAEKASKESFPIHSFLASLSLTAASPWCSGAWLLPDHTLHCTGAIFRTLLFWKSAERIVLHTWRAGMDSGLSSVFFFCTNVRQVLLSSLQETVWLRLAELTAAYRESLQFEAGVLYTYRSLESFTIDNATFLRECEFYTLCGPQFQCRVCPVLRAMVDAVEEAERALRFAQVSTRVARRQYMATFRSMVGSGSSSDSGSDSDGGTDSDCCRQARGRPVASAPRHVFTLSRWSRRARKRQSAGKAQAGGSVAWASPWHLQPLEDALARHSEELSPPEATSGRLTDVDAPDTESEVDVDSAGTPRRRAEKGRKGPAVKAKRSPSSAVSSAVAARFTTPVLDKSLLALLSTAGGEEETHREGDSASTAAPRKKRRRGGSQPAGARQPTTATAAPMATTLRASATAQRSQTPKCSRSAEVSVRRSPAPAEVSSSAVAGAAKTATPAMKRPRRGRRQQKRMPSAERKERRCKLRAIAERKIKEEVDHQRRLVRDMISRQLRRFAWLTQSLRNALSEVMVEEDVKGMEDESIAATATATSDGASLKSIKDLHKAQRQHMNRNAYISTILRKLDALIEVMATQV